MFRKNSETEIHDDQKNLWIYSEIYHQMANKCPDQSSAHRKKTEWNFYDSVLKYHETSVRESDHEIDVGNYFESSDSFLKKCFEWLNEVPGRNM